MLCFYIFDLNPHNIALILAKFRKKCNNNQKTPLEPLLLEVIFSQSFLLLLNIAALRRGEIG